MSKKDYCTLFPENWYVWVRWFKWEKVSISDCCKLHDEDCSTHDFLDCLKKKKIVGYYAIAFGGGIGCWAKYTSKMFKKL